MPIRVHETQESRTLRDGYETNQKGIDLEFVAWDDNNTDLSPADVEDAVLAVVDNAPYGNPLLGLYRQTILLRPLTRSVFLATVVYGAYDKLSIRFGFRSEGGVEHVTNSLATIARYAATGYTAPNFNTAVNVNESGPQGYQRKVKQISFWVTRYFDPVNWVAADWLNILDLCDTYNLAPWHTWPAKSVLFDDFEAPEIIFGQTAAVPVKFYFRAKKAEVVNPGDGINFTKDPWDLVWPDFVSYADGGSKRRAYKLRSMHREQVNYGSDFTLLGLD